MDSRKILINYADPNYRKAQKLCSWSGKHIAGFDEIIEYGPEHISDDYREKYKDIFSIKRGGGLWLWKPYLINKTLAELQEGDYLCYIDSGEFFIGNVDKLIRAMGNEDVFVNNVPLMEKEWTSHSVLKALDIDLDSEIAVSPQVQGSPILIRKTPFSCRVMEEWLSLCQNIHYLQGEPSETAAHREDQSLLSIVCKKEGIHPHRDPSQYGRIPEKYHIEGKEFLPIPHCEDRYPAMMICHRSGSADVKTIAAQWLLTWLPLSVIQIIRNAKKRREHTRGNS